MSKAEGDAVVVAYKGFDRQLRCRGMQFQVGMTYEHEGAVALCHSGFHACLEPFDVLTYYSIGESRFARVELRGVSTVTEADTKRVARSITICEELTLDGLLAAQIAWTRAMAKGKAASSGDYSKAASSGDYSKAASSGYSSKAASSGYYSTAASSGDSSKAASSGDSSTAASSGYSSTAASSGDSSTAASSGYSSTAASSGDSSTAASSGYSSKAASSGDSSTAASSGNSSKAECDTKGFAMVAGVNGMVRGNAGSALAVGYVDASGRNRIAVGCVGEDGIEPGTWYRADQSGTLVSA